MGDGLGVRWRGAFVRLIGAPALCLSGSFALATSLPVRDQNPLLAGFELPSALPTQLPESQTWSFDTSFAWANSALVQAGARERIVIDAETRELRFAVARTFDSDYTLRMELPLRQTSGGVLDGFIDEWHEFFGLPEGARPTFARDELRILYERDGTVLIDERSRQSGIGDVSIQLGKKLSDGPLTGWIGIKLPTGDADRLTGSGSVDAMAALAFEHRFGDRYRVFAQAAGSWLGEGDRMTAQQEDFAWSGSAGISARTVGNLRLTVQVDAHTRVFDSDEDFLGESILLTIGGSYSIGNAWDLSFAVAEDIAVESAPDVTFIFQLKRAAR